jgi:hypothetical protein
MKRAGVVCLGVIGLGLLGFAGFEWHTLGQLRERRVSLVARQSEMDAELKALRRERSAAAAELAQAEQQLAALPASRAEALGVRPEHLEEIERWLVQVRRLRETFIARPEWRIPEMQFLKAEDWLRVAKTYAMETDDQLRAASAEIRSAATGRFAERLSAALRKYIAANQNKRPASVEVLGAYFDEPVDPAIIERYTLVDRPSTAPGMVLWAVANKTPIDSDYDARYQLFGSGGMTIQSGPLAWNPELLERYRAAAGRFRQASPNQAARNLEALLPYFDPPLEPKWAERLRKSENRRN